MPEKPKTNNTSQILEELQQLNETVEDLQAFIERAAKKQRKTRISQALINGMINAVGVIIGTLVMTAVLIYAGQAVIRSDAFQKWVSDSVKEAVTNAAQNAVDSELNKFGF